MNSKEAGGSKSEISSLRSSVSSTRQNSYQSKDLQKAGVVRELSPRINLLGSGRDFKVYAPLRQDKRETSPLLSRRNSCSHKQISPIRSTESLTTKQPSKTYDTNSSKQIRKNGNKPTSPINNRPEIKKLDLNLVEKSKSSPKPANKVSETEPSPSLNFIQKSKSTQIDKSKVITEKSPSTRAKVIPREKSPSTRAKVIPKDKSPSTKPKVIPVEKSPVTPPKSNLRDKTPTKVSTPKDTRSKSPINRNKSPTNLNKTVNNRAKSPVNTVKPLASTRASPSNLAKSPASRVKSPTCGTKASTVTRTTITRTSSKVLKQTESNTSPRSNLNRKEGFSPTFAPSNRKILTSSQEVSPKLLSKTAKIKDKIRAEARGLQTINSNSQSKNLARTVAKVLQRSVRRYIQASFAQIYSEQQFRWEYEQMKLRDFSKLFKTRLFNAWRLKLQQKKQKEEDKLEMARRHYNLQLIINAFTNWMDFFQNRKLKPEDRSKIDEIDTILMSFNLTSIAHEANVSDNSRLYDESPLRLNISNIRHESSIDVFKGNQILFTDEPDKKPNILNISPVTTPKRKYSLNCIDNTLQASAQKEDGFKPRVKSDHSTLSLSEDKETDPLEQIAILHNEKALQVRCIQYFYGFLPWRLAIINKKLRINHDEKLAIDFYNSKLQQKAVHRWLEFYILSYSNQEVPYNHYKKQLKKKTLKTWKDFIITEKQRKADPYAEIIKTFRLTFVAPVIFDKWKQFVQISKRERSKPIKNSPRKPLPKSKKSKS